MQHAVIMGFVALQRASPTCRECGFRCPALHSERRYYSMHVSPLTLHSEQAPLGPALLPCNELHYATDVSR